jgi:hypothetical protein
VPHEQKEAQTNIYIFSPMIWCLNLVVAGKIEALGDPSDRQRHDSQFRRRKLEWTSHFGHLLRNEKGYRKSKLSFKFYLNTSLK